MPEGPEAHHSSFILNQKLAGSILESIDCSMPNTHFDKNDFRTLKFPAKLTSVFAVGKKIVFVFECGAHLVFSMGMTGHFLFEDGGPRIHTRLTMSFSVPRKRNKNGKDSKVKGNRDEKDSKNYEANDSKDSKNYEANDSKDSKTDDEKKYKTDDEKKYKTDDKESKEVKEESKDDKDIYYMAIDLHLEDVRKQSGTNLFSSKETFEKYRNNKLGLDPLEETSSDKDELFDDWKAVFANRKSIIANLLVKQELICGIGNYLRSEILYKAGIHPRRLASGLTNKELKRLLRYTMKVMRSALVSGGHTIKDYLDPRGIQGGYKSVIYDRARTNDEHKYTVHQMKVGQTIYWTPERQKLKAVSSSSKDDEKKGAEMKTADNIAA